MAGLDNLTADILSEARKEADELIAAAREKGASIEEEARARADEIFKEGEERAAAAAEAHARRIESQIGLSRRESALRARQGIIEDVIDRAREKISSMDAGEYFGMLETLIGTHIRKGEGQLLLSASDLARLPEGFADRVAKAAAEKGGSLTLLEEGCDIDGGFVLRYGGIDENCSLKALFAEKQDMLRDKVREILWK